MLSARTDHQQQNYQPEQHQLENRRTQDQRPERLDFTDEQRDDGRATEIPQAAGDDDDERVQYDVGANGRVDDVSGNSSPPARADSPDDSIRARMYTLGTGTPSAAAMGRFWATARNQMP